MTPVEIPHHASRGRKCPFGEDALIVGGDGYAYQTYAWASFSQQLAPYALYHLGLMRVNSAGVSDNSEVYSSLGSVEVPYFGSLLIANGDTGVLLSFRPNYLGSTPTHLAISTGTSVSQIATLAMPGDNQDVEPVLQAQDGSFVGSYFDDSNQFDMVAFDGSGNVRWIVPNDSPKIATADGGVIGTSGITYDQNGNAMGQMNLATYSWLGNAYQVGSVDQMMVNPLYFAASFWAFQGGNQSGNKAAYFRRDSIANSKVYSLLTPGFWRKFAGSHCGGVLANTLGMAAMGITNYSLQGVQNKQGRTNFYDVANSGVGNLTVREVTGGQVGNSVTLTDYLNNAGATAATANMGYDRQTAVVMQPSVLSGQHPEFTLVHEIVFHAYAGLLDNAIFGNTYFQQQGLWRPSGSTATVNVSTWMSTDCTCTPGNPQVPACQSNTAQW